MNDSNNLVLKRIGTYDLTGYRLGKGNFAHVELATNRVTKTKVCCALPCLLIFKRVDLRLNHCAHCELLSRTVGVEIQNCLEPFN